MARERNVIRRSGSHGHAYQETFIYFSRSKILSAITWRCYGFIYIFFFKSAIPLGIIAAAMGTENYLVCVLHLVV
jgi:hypothetical protein